MNSTKQIEPSAEESQSSLNEPGDGGISKLWLFVFVTITTIVGLELGGHVGGLALFGGIVGLFTGFLLFPIVARMINRFVLTKKPVSTKPLWHNQFTFGFSVMLLIAGCTMNLILYMFDIWAYGDDVRGGIRLISVLFITYSLIGIPALIYNYYRQYRKQPFKASTKLVILLLATVPFASLLSVWDDVRSIL